jgi:hypothetical protein
MKIVTLGCIASILCAGTGHANCDNSSLQGQYAFKVQGANVGVFDSMGTLHPFASPLLVNAVGHFSFDGNGSLSRIDYNVSNGTPTITAATPLTEDGFRTGQTGSYSIGDDCTGNLVLNVPGGRVIQIAIALVDYGQGVLGVVKAEHAPSLPAALLPADTACDSGCDLGDNILVEMTRNVLRRR